MWEKSETAANKALKKLANKSDSELLEYVVKEDDEEDKLERMTKCDMMQKVFSKAMQCYRDGDYTYKKTLDELIDAFEDMK